MQGTEDHIQDSGLHPASSEKALKGWPRGAPKSIVVFLKSTRAPESGWGWNDAREVGISIPGPSSASCEKEEG